MLPEDSLLRAVIRIPGLSRSHSAVEGARTGPADDRRNRFCEDDLHAVCSWAIGRAGDLPSDHWEITNLHGDVSWLRSWPLMK